MRLCTRFHFVMRNEFLLETGRKYMPAPAFDKKVMARDCFNNKILCK